MASSSSSSSSPRNWRYNVFTSFHGPDVRKTFLSHLRKQFSCNGISMFDDQGIERSQVIPPALTQAISDSKISIVVLSKNYASSSWCLDELVEIFKCREEIGQIVMTIFYGVDPSDVRNQIGDFGIAFKETCARKTEEHRQKWSKALNDVGNIAGEHFHNWDTEAEMIEKIAKDVLDKLNTTQSRDFDGMVGIQAHLSKMESLLDLDYDGVKVVAITGPAGIGKTTIARALKTRLSDRFQLTHFEDSLRMSFHSGFDVYGSKLHLQEQFLSKVLNHDRMRIRHLGAVKENLGDQKVLIILDDVNNLNQLEALANETTWFGPGSRIVVTTENQELLQQHGIDNTYHVGFPSKDEALEIFCSYAFRKSSPSYGFEKYLGRITELCGNLPLALRVVGSSLRGKEEDEWKYVVYRLETTLDRDIEDVLRVGYESLNEKEQTLFLHIAVFYKHQDYDLVKATLGDGEVDVERGLKILAKRSLIEMSAYAYKNTITMHTLLRQMAQQAIRKQEPWKRQILIDADEICDVLENEKGTHAVSGISFDISGINELTIGRRAFKRMPNLQLLNVYKSRHDGNDMMHIPEAIEFPCRLRLLLWVAYPSKFLPPTFHPESLVVLCMQNSQLEYLWKGIQKLPNLKKMDLCGSFHLKVLPDLSTATKLERLYLDNCESLVEIPSKFLPESLVVLCMLNSQLEYLWKGIQKLPNLKKMDLSGSHHLKELPDLSTATKLEELHLDYCKSLVEIPSSFSHLQKLTCLNMEGCVNLQVIPPDLYLPSLEVIGMDGCLKLKTVPFIPTETWFDEPPSVGCNGKLKGITHLPMSLRYLYLSDTKIERIPDCIKAFDHLDTLIITGCKRLSSLPELPGSLKNLEAGYCGSLETVRFARKPKILPEELNFTEELNFINCYKLGQQARRDILLLSFSYMTTILPGSKVPAEFDHRASGNTLTIPLHGNNFPPPRFPTLICICVILSPNHQISENIHRGETQELMYRRIGKGDLEAFQFVCPLGNVSSYRAKHLVISHTYLDLREESREIVLEFSCSNNSFPIIECGAYICAGETSKIPKSISPMGPNEDTIQYPDLTIRGRRKSRRQRRIHRLLALGLPLFRFHRLRKKHRQPGFGKLKLGYHLHLSIHIRWNCSS